MITFIKIVHIFVCLFLIIFVLIQSGKGRGLAGAFGSFAGGTAQNLFGVRTTDVLTKITAYLTVGFFGCAILLAFLYVKQSESVVKDITHTVSKTPTHEAKDLSKKIGDMTDKLLKKTENNKTIPEKSDAKEPLKDTDNTAPASNKTPETEETDSGKTQEKVAETKKPS